MVSNRIGRNAFGKMKNKKPTTVGFLSELSLKLSSLLLGQQVPKRQPEQRQKLPLQLKQQLERKRLERQVQEQQQVLAQEQLAFRHKQKGIKRGEQQRVRSISSYFLN